MARTTAKNEPYSYERSIHRARPVELLPFTHEDRMKDQHARSKTNINAFGMTERDEPQVLASLVLTCGNHKSRQIAAANGKRNKLLRPVQWPHFEGQTQRKTQDEVQVRYPQMSLVASRHPRHKPVVDCCSLFLLLRYVNHISIKQSNERLKTQTC